MEKSAKGATPSQTDSKEEFHSHQAAVYSEREGTGVCSCQNLTEELKSCSSQTSSEQINVTDMYV